VFGFPYMVWHGGADSGALLTEHERGRSGCCAGLSPNATIGLSTGSGLWALATSHDMRLWARTEEEAERCLARLGLTGAAGVCPFGHGALAAVLGRRRRGVRAARAGAPSAGAAVP
jgi:hypothetical protein